MDDLVNRNPRTELEESETFIRLPGLHRRWEIQELLEPGCILHVEEAGEDSDGTTLYAVYRLEAERP